MKNKTNKTKIFVPALGYDWLTNFYDVTIKLTMPEKKFRQKLISLLDSRKGDEILEFGFGTGQNLLLAYRNNENANYTGLDIDPKVKAIAEQKIMKVKAPIALELYSGGNFPFYDNSFDKVFSSLVFHQLDGPTKKHCMNEIFRVVKPGGRLLIGDWGKAKSKVMRLAFYTVQMLDGFKTTEENVRGLLPEYIMEAGFSEVKEVDFINTKIGTYSYYSARKAIVS